MANTISGNPTKSFFIEMITRDISIKDAIVDLIDNSIDGANRINKDDYRGRKVEIYLSRDSFKVSDNCGGFSLETATKYAFRFGRPDDAPSNAGSVGRFGIGMKRALFKMGRNFVVESKHNDEHFEVSVDVDEWKNKKTIDAAEDWSFSYQLLQDGKLSNDGTHIEVTNLTNEVASLFSQETFIQGLKDDIERLLNFSLEKGIEIFINDNRLSHKNIQLFYGDNIKPYSKIGESAKVHYKVIAGISKTGDPSSSGWYIYCNNRLVVEADKSELCGWGTYGVRKWHIDYAMFRGIVFIDAEDTLLLPLTTTKKGIDSTSEVYMRVLSIMKEAMLDVMTYLNSISKIDEAQNFRLLLEDTLPSVSVVEMKNQIMENSEFIAPPVDIQSVSVNGSFVHITYSINKDLAFVAKKHADARSFSELGKLTFDYYVNMEELCNNE